MFYTPENQQYILDWIDKHPPNDRPHLITVMMMTWNYLAEKVNNLEPKPLGEILGPTENVGSEEKEPQRYRYSGDIRGE